MSKSKFSAEEYPFTEENFQKMVEYAPIGIVIIDGDLRWKFVNQRFCDIIGYSKQELASKSFIDITYQDDVKNNVELYMKMLSGEVDQYEYEKRYVRKDGTIIWAHLNVSAIRKNGSYSHMVATIQDIDEKRRYQEALELKNKELDTMFYRASHDLKSPVTTLQGLCHLLKIDHRVLEKDPTFLHLEQTVNLLKLQNQRLLMLTQINEHVLDAGSVLLTKAVSNIEKQLKLKGTMVSHINLDRVVPVDSYLLNTVLTNILENCLAHKAPARELKIKITLQQEPGRNLILISDNGVGISPEVRAHSFDMFFKDSSSLQATGLELYIVKKAIDRLKGEIQLESEVGKGTIFSIFLPSL